MSPSRYARAPSSGHTLDLSPLNDDYDDEDRLHNGLCNAVGLKLGGSLVYKDRETIVGAQKFFFWHTLDQLKANQQISLDRWGLASTFSLYPYQVVLLYMVTLRNQGKVKGGILLTPWAPRRR
ncbi:hypothetical protein NX059_012299 [Plenodomus lindquistii]|nr:hypothetical protein NX059_012299 [Plenodomus lindquistii]